MAAIFSTPRGDANIFTPRGTLNPALQLGMPMKAQEQKQDIAFAADWVQNTFEGGGSTQRVNSSEEIDAKMTEATEWLMQAFGTPRGTQVGADADALRVSAMYVHSCGHLCALAARVCALAHSSWHGEQVPPATVLPKPSMTPRNTVGADQAEDKGEHSIATHSPSVPFARTSGIRS